MNHEFHGKHERGRSSGSVGTPRPTLVRGFPTCGKQKKKGASRMLPLLLDGTLRVGMSVPAHPPPCGELLLVRGYRGWLKPPPPEEVFGTG